MKTVEVITQAALCLHNFLQVTNSAAYAYGIVDSEQVDGEILEGDWRTIVNGQSALLDLGKAKGGRVSSNTKEIQNMIKDYLNSTNGAVDWQLEYIRHT